MGTCEREITYRCSNDCLMQGCPTHNGKLIFQSVSDAYTFVMNGRELNFERNELQAMFDLIKLLDRVDAVSAPPVPAGPETPRLTNAELSHLRRLLGWARCEVGPSPEQHKAIVGSVLDKIGVEAVSDEGRARLVEAHRKYERVPGYVRAAIKALEKAVEPHVGQTLNGEENEQLPARIES